MEIKYGPGYEHFLLKILVEEGYKDIDIVTKRSNVPEIWYKTNENEKHRYFCDVYIPSTKTIYEVKSTWTYEKDMEYIPLKKQACIEKGYNFQLYVFDNKSKISLKEVYQVSSTMNSIT